MAVRMTHPELPGVEIAVAPSAVPHHIESGWAEAPGQDEHGEQWPPELLPFGGQPTVRLRHPDLDTEITVAQSAVPFHRDKGWVLVEGPAAEEQAAPGLEAKTVPELRELAKARGITPIPTTKPELLEALSAAPPEQPTEDQAGEPAPSEEDES